MKDAQGGRFHLLFGEADWRGCQEWVNGAKVGPILLDERTDPPTRFELDEATGSLRLAHRDPVLRRRQPGEGFPPEQRRGADRDRYGTWYWIAEDRRSILRLSEHGTVADPWWSVDDLSDRCQRPGAFAPEAAPLPRVARLAGLAVTTGHHLVAGLDDDPGGLLLFDLHARGGPTVLRWPDDQAVTPFDLAATSDGGILVLDRRRRTWWHLDHGLRLPANVGPGRPAVFQPVPPGGGPARVEAGAVAASGRILESGPPHLVLDPVAIEEGPDGTVLVLDRRDDGPSAVIVLRADEVLGRLELTVEARDPERPDQPSFTYDIAGHDLAFVPAREGDERPLEGPVLYVADAVTTQTLAFRLGVAPPDLDVLTEYLPMRRWEGRAIVDAGGHVAYDAVGRWVPLEPFGACSFEPGPAAFRTPTGFGPGGDPVPGQPFDSGQPGCVWHRLFLDADIPTGTSVRVEARASDDPQLLELLAFSAQPSPYLRSGGSELPWHDPWSGARRPTSPRTGSWELLFQQVRGRYLQLQVTMTGTGRSTPSLRALRAWFPRFSYVGAYLPAVYQEEDASTGLLERLLANVEGYLTDLESKIDAVPALLDAAATPSDALDWLAGWVGLSLEPAWSERGRFLVGHADRFYRERGTVGGLLSVLRLYLGCSTEVSLVFDPRTRNDDPVRLVEQLAVDGPHRFRVLVAGSLSAEQIAMVRRIVEVAKPAHTGFELRVYQGLFVVGEVRVGIDTLLGASARFVPMTLDRTNVGAGYVAPDHPFEITDRIVSDRDRIGELAPL